MVSHCTHNFYIHCSTEHLTLLSLPRIVLNGPANVYSEYSSVWFNLTGIPS